MNILIAVFERIRHINQDLMSLLLVKFPAIRIILPYELLQAFGIIHTVTTVRANTVTTLAIA